MKRLQWFMAVLLVVSVSSAAAFGQKKKSGEKGPPRMPVTRAVCVLHALGDSKAAGTVTFTQGDGYVEIQADVTGLTPGKHGFHIHEFGDCTSADGTSTGGHFNPTHMPHGSLNDEKRHEGDMGNIEADASGKATLKIRDKQMKLNGPLSIVGRGVIVHAKPDDYSQPTGNAGGRVACGVIGVGKAS
jgi:superoxide dismutase, Cu-Zn family